MPPSVASGVCSAPRAAVNSFGCAASVFSGSGFCASACSGSGFAASGCSGAGFASGDVSSALSPSVATLGPPSFSPNRCTGCSTFSAARCAASFSDSGFGSGFGSGGFSAFASGGGGSGFFAGGGGSALAVSCFLGGSGGGTRSTLIAFSGSASNSDTGSPKIKSAAASACTVTEAGKAHPSARR